MDQENFTPAKLGERYGPTIRDIGQHEIRVQLPHARRINRTVTRRSAKTKRSASQHQRAQISNRPCHMAIHDTLSSPAGKLQLPFFRTVPLLSRWSEHGSP
jgi:hypothetical protein